jgi:hypothetical protein
MVSSLSQYRPRRLALAASGCCLLQQCGGSFKAVFSRHVLCGPPILQEPQAKSVRLRRILHHSPSPAHLVRGPRIRACCEEDFQDVHVPAPGRAMQGGVPLLCNQDHATCISHKQPRAKPEGQQRKWRYPPIPPQVPAAHIFVDCMDVRAAAHQDLDNTQVSARRCCYKGCAASLHNERRPRKKCAVNVGCK